MRGHRGHPAYWAFVVHRVSGVALALFLPVHFWALGRAIQGEAALESFLAWTRNPLAKAAETLLVLLLAVHLTGGLRVLALEFLPWSPRQKTAIAGSAGAALLIGLLFVFNLGAGA